MINILDNIHKRFINKIKENNSKLKELDDKYMYLINNKNEMKISIKEKDSKTKGIRI